MGQNTGLDAAHRASVASLEHDFEDTSLSARKRKSKTKSPSQAKSKSGRKSDLRIQSFQKSGQIDDLGYGRTDVPEPTHEENLPFVLFEIELYRSFVPLFSTENNEKE